MHRYLCWSQILRNFICNWKLLHLQDNEAREIAKPCCSDFVIIETFSMISVDDNDGGLLDDLPDMEEDPLPNNQEDAQVSHQRKKKWLSSLNLFSHNAFSPNRKCHPGGHCWDSPDVLYLIQVTATRLKIGHPYISSTGARSSGYQAVSVKNDSWATWPIACLLNDNFPIFLIIHIL